MKWIIFQQANKIIHPLCRAGTLKNTGQSHIRLFFQTGMPVWNQTAGDSLCLTMYLLSLIMQKTIRIRHGLFIQTYRLSSLQPFYMLSQNANFKSATTLPVFRLFPYFFLASCNSFFGLKPFSGWDKVRSKPCSQGHAGPWMSFKTRWIRLRKTTSAIFSQGNSAPDTDKFHIYSRHAFSGRFPHAVR